MKAMSIPYELNGRSHQKRRTRDALVAAARELVAQGHTPTVEGAAQAAVISRTTAYRYFPNQRALLAAAHPETAMTSLLPDDAPDDDVETRVDLVVESYTGTLLQNEAQQRTMLRLSLEPDPHPEDLPLRQGRVIGWLEDALEPLRGQLPQEEIRRLALAIRSATGIEALVWLTDIGGLSRDEAVALMRWSARAMLRAALSA